MFTLIGIVLLSTIASEEPARVRRISLEEAQARAAETAAADLAQLGIDAARYHREAAQADYFPKIDSTFANLHFNKIMGETIQLVRRTAELPLAGKDQTVVAFTITQPVTPLFKVHNAVEIAKADERVAAAKAAQIRNAAAANVEKTYLSLLIAQRQRTPAAKELTRSLNALLGFASETQLELIAPEPLKETISLEGATQQAIANSLEIVAAEQAVVKARAATRLSKLDYVPDVAVIGGYAYQTAIPLLPKDFTYIGVVATLNLFDFGKREKTINERRTQLEMAEANVQLVRAKVAASAQNAFLDLKRAERIRDLTRRVVTSVRYDTAAEEEMYQAELDYRIAFSDLKRVIAGQ
jgi:outer membrane protein TolC